MGGTRACFTSPNRPTRDPAAWAGATRGDWPLARPPSLTLAAPQILGAQQPKSDQAGFPAHDEHLFIVIHQVYELWFKQVLHEIDSCAKIMNSECVQAGAVPPQRSAPPDAAPPRCPRQLRRRSGHRHRGEPAEPGDGDSAHPGLPVDRARDDDTGSRLRRPPHDAARRPPLTQWVTQLNFLDFRDFLFPASGFQSVQFRLLEVRPVPASSQLHAAAL